MRLPSSLGLFWIVLGLLGGCTGAREAELLEVHDVGPERLEPGRVLFVRGAGFPPGRPARVRLEGTMHRPGAPPGPVRMELDGRAVSSERVEARFHGEALAALGGRGSLHGTVSVLFATADGAGAVVGTSASRVLDITPASGRALREELERTRDAAEWLERSGLALSERGPDEAGLPIQAVAEGSPAARAGLIAGDRIVGMEGVTTYQIQDLAPSTENELATLRVARRGEAAPFAVRLPVEMEGAELGPDTVLAAQLALGWILLMLLFLAPSAGVSDAIARRLRRRATPASSRPRGWIPRLALALAALAALPALDRAGLLVVPVELVLLVAFALRVSATWLAQDGRDSRARRALSLLHAAGSVALLALGFIALAALGGTTDLSLLHALQGRSPLEWTLLRTPLGPLVLAVVVAGATSAPAALARGQGSSARIARAIDDGVLLAVAALTTATLLGGWGGATEPPSVRAGLAALFVGIGVGLFVWMRRAREEARPTVARVLGAGALALTLISSTAARVVLSPPAALEPALAQVVAGAVLALALAVAFRLLTRRVPAHPAPMHPYL